MEGVGDFAHQVFFCHALVDDVAQALRSGFGRERQAGFLLLLRRLQRILQHTVQAQRRQRNRHMLLVQTANQLANQLRQTGIVAGGQARQADFLIPGRVFELLRHFHQMFEAPLAHRAVQDARLTEAAAARAAAHDFQHDAVVDNLHVRHGDFRGIERLVQVRDNRFEHLFGRFGAVRLHGRNRAVRVILHVIECRDVHAADGAQALEDRHAARALFAPLHDDAVEVEDLLFAVADHERVNKIRQRFGIERARPARDDNRVFLPAIFPQKRNAAKLQHRQNVGVAHFILQRKAHDVKGAERTAAFEREQRDFLLLHQVHHVHPRHKRALAEHIRLLIHRGIENLHAQMGHADLVGIRKAERKMQLRAVPRLELRIHFPAGIARRLLHLIEHPGDGFLVDFGLQSGSTSLTVQRRIRAHYNVSFFAVKVNCFADENFARLIFLAKNSRFLDLTRWILQHILDVYNFQMKRASMCRLMVPLHKEIVPQKICTGGRFPCATNGFWRFWWHSFLC